MLGTTFLVSSLVPASLLVALNVLLILMLSENFPALIASANWINANPTPTFWLSAALSVGLGFALTALQDIISGLFRGEYFIWLLTPLRKWHQGKYADLAKEIEELVEQQETEKDEDIKTYLREQCERRLNEFRRVYPELKDEVKSTALGNVFAALECEIINRYSISQAVMWPRLAQVVSTTYGQIVVNTNTYMHFLLNTSLVLLVFVFEMLWVFIFEILGTFPFRLDMFYWSVLCLLLAVASERLALPTACTYCDYVSGCFDLFRHDLLRQMNLPLPQGVQDEQEIWYSLTNYLVTGDECDNLLGCYDYSRYGPQQEPARSVDGLGQKPAYSVVERTLMYALTIGFLIGGAWVLLKRSKSREGQ